MAKVPNVPKRNIAENFNRLSRVHERYRQTDDRHTDGPAITYSERQREFTFAKKGNVSHTNIDIQTMLVWLTLHFYDFCCF